MGKKYKNETLLPSDAEGSDSLHDLKSDKVFRQYANRQLPLSTERTNSTLTPYTGPWTRKEVIHLLRRTTFGLRSADINSLLVLNPSKAVDLLIDSVPDTTPDPPLNNYNAKTKDTTGVLPDQTWVNAEYGDGRGIRNRINQQIDCLGGIQCKQSINICVSQSKSRPPKQMNYFLACPWSGVRCKSGIGSFGTEGKLSVGVLSKYLIRLKVMKRI